MDKISSVWAELQKCNRLPSGMLMSSCQAELKELLYQLDLMLSSKKQQWAKETEELQTRLLAKDRELRSQQTALEMKNQEMEDMKSQMEGLNKAQKAIVDEYEEHLSSLRSEVLKVRKEYERLHKQHQRYKKDLQKKKEQVMDEKRESDEEILRLQGKLEEHEGRERDLELRLRSKQNAVDVLESQRQSLTEKCEFLQQKVKTYQCQLDQQGGRLASNDDCMSRITHLEAAIERSTKTIVTQKEKIDKLKGSLEDAMSSHKKTMTDNEKLLEDLRKANETIQMLELRIAQLEEEMHTKIEQLKTALEDSHHYSHNLSRLEETLNAKDDIIRHMSVTHDVEESDQVKRLKNALECAREDLNQKQAAAQIRQSSAASTTGHLTPTGTSPYQMGDQNTEILRLHLEVKNLQDKLSTLNETHSAELTAMRQKLASLTTELHQRNTALSALSERSCELEGSVLNETDMLVQRVSELKAAQSEIEALRAENRHLRQEVMLQSGAEFRQQNHSWNNQEGQLARREMTLLQNSVEDVERQVRSQQNSAHTNSSSASEKLGYPGSREQNTSGQFKVMDEYLDSSIRRHDDQLQFIEAQKARLESQLSQSSRQNLRIAAEARRLREASALRESCDNYNYHTDDSLGSEAMSFVTDKHYPIVDHLVLPDSSSDDELPDMAEETSKAFYDQEHRHASDLARRIEDRISSFTHGLHQS